MVGRAILRVGIGLYIGLYLWRLVDSLHGIHVPLAFQTYQIILTVEHMMNLCYSQHCFSCRYVFVLSSREFGSDPRSDPFAGGQLFQGHREGLASLSGTYGLFGEP